ncbi:MAG: phage tail sheath subtilisin-like domain-containing protein [Spirochaetaceae bacterium]|jgi:hypothetical protein|nr:phage tail sheath subtilisin-like domain-containing protein [Spirochaetaceae bacterium]
MGVSGAVFESAGKRTVHWIPGVYSRRNTVPSGTGTVANNLVIMGNSMGGMPNTLIPVTDVSEARELLAGGQLLDAVAHAFNGSNDYVPQQVYAMRVNKGTRSSITLKNGSTDIISVKSKDYGVHTNQIKIWVQNGKAPNSKKILVNFKGNEVVQDNIVRKSISVRYSGEGSSASMTVTNTGCDLYAADDPDANMTITWDECETLEALVSRLNDSGFYVATLIDDRPNVKTAELDTASAVSIMGNADFYSNLYAFCTALASMQYIGEVEIVSNSMFAAPGDTGSFIYFSGATAGTYTVADWADSLEALEKEDVQSITTPSTDHDVRILISNHITSMCKTETRKERQGLCGLPKGTGLEDAIAAAKELNSEYMSLVIDDAVANNPITGASENIDPGMLACKIAGMEAGTSVATALTNKQLKVNAFGQKRKTSDLNLMIQNGIMPCGINEDGLLVVIRAMTTYQDDNLALNERSCVREALYMDRDLRKAFSRRVGTTSMPSKDEIIGCLRRKAEQWRVQGLITTSGSGELVFDIKVRFDGDKTYLEYSKNLRAPNNFTFITSNNMIYSSAAAA